VLPANERSGFPQRDFETYPVATRSLKLMMTHLEVHDDPSEATFEQGTPAPSKANGLAGLSYLLPMLKTYADVKPCVDDPRGATGGLSVIAPRSGANHMSGLHRTAAKRASTAPKWVAGSPTAVAE
jgi:hypothetical protein